VVREELNPDLRSGPAAGRAPARGVGGPFPPRNLALPSGDNRPPREGQGRPAYAGRGSGHLPLAGVGWKLDFKGTVWLRAKLTARPVLTPMKGALTTHQIRGCH